MEDESGRQYNRYDIKRLIDELYDSNKLKSVDDAESYYNNNNNNMLSGIEGEADYQHIISHNIQLYEIPIEVITEPVVYEVPINLRVAH